MVGENASAVAAAGNIMKCYVYQDSVSGGDILLY